MPSSCDGETFTQGNVGAWIMGDEFSQGASTPTEECNKHLYYGYQDLSTKDPYSATLVFPNIIWMSILSL